jgi:hypothetical protein
MVYGREPMQTHKTPQQMLTMGDRAFYDELPAQPSLLTHSSGHLVTLQCRLRESVTGLDERKGALGWLELERF